MPYNDFFWENNDEFEIFDHGNQNNLFYRENEAFSNRIWYSPDNEYFEKTYESPFIPWSEKRIVIKEITEDTLNSNSTNPGIIADKYKLGVKIFMDINTYSDSTNVLTSTVFDPWQTYYHLHVDSATNCFLNIYFDICEIERRHFVNKIHGLGNNKEEILYEYERLCAKLEKLTNRYLLEVDRGTKTKKMEQWNQYIVDNLGINNMRLFNLCK